MEHKSRTDGTTLSTVSQVANDLGLSEQMIYLAIQRGELVAHRFGRAIRVSGAGVEAWLAQTATGGLEQNAQPVGNAIAVTEPEK